AAGLVGRVLALNLDDRRYSTESVAVRNDVDAAVAGESSRACLVAHGSQQGCGELLEVLVADLPVEALENDVARVLLDSTGAGFVGVLLGGFDDRLDLACEVFDRLVASGQDGEELLGALADGEHREHGTDLPQGRLAEDAAIEPDSQPGHVAPVPVRRCGRVVTVVTGDATDVDGAVGTVRSNDDVTNLHLVPEPDQVPYPDGPGLRLPVWIYACQLPLEAVSVGGQLPQITGLVPADADEAVIDQLTGQSVVVDPPHVRHVGIAFRSCAVSLFLTRTYPPTPSVA